MKMPSLLDSVIFKTFKRKKDDSSSSSVSKKKVEETQEKWVTNVDSEEKVIAWTVNSSFLLALDATVNKKFEAGQTLGIVSDWEFILKCRHIDGKNYWGMYCHYDSFGQPLNLTNPGDSKDTKISHYAKFDVEILNSEPSSVKFSGTKTDWTQQEYWGFKKLVATDALADFLNNGNLKMKITFTVTVSRSTKSNISITNNLTPSLRPKNDTDMILKTTDGRQFYVHRNVLAVRSEHLKKVVYEVMSFEQSNPILVVSYPFDVMKSIVCYLYSGEIPSALVNPNEVDIALAEQIAEAATVYGLDTLRVVLLDRYPGLKDRIENKNAEMPS